MKPSKYQQTILNWLKDGTGNATCNAVAGSGKSTILKLAAETLQKQGILPRDIKIIVFGKQNSLDLIAKFGFQWKQSIQTLYSVGFRILQKEIGRFHRDEKVITSKYRRIAEDWKLIPRKINKRVYKGSLIESQAISQVEHFLTLIDLVRLTLSDLSVDSIRRLVYHHNLEGIHNFSRVSGAIADILIEGQEQAINQHRIDYTHMIWLPVEWGLNKNRWFQTYQWVLVDEAQDLNATQLELSLMLASGRQGRSEADRGGRMLYVADPRQAIYGFAGADNRSYQKIVERTQATELPLSLCYRCPKSHILLVNQIFPDIPIEPKPDAPEGILESIDRSDLWNNSHPGHLVIGDMVLSRKTAPLVSLCIRLIGQGIAATVKGKDIGKQIKFELEAIAEINGFTYNRFGEFVEIYKKFKFQTYEGRDNAEQLEENLSDKLSALRTIYSSQPNAKSIDHLCTYIDDLFSDEESPITLSTCHRAKGLEGDRIFIIKPDDMPMTWEKQLGWQKEQEDNLLYVALTRSKSALYIVGKPSWLENENAEEKTETSETSTETSDNNAATSPANSVSSSNSSNGNDLHSSDVKSVMALITKVFSFEQKCELLSWLNDEVTQEKWDRVFQSLQEDANRSDRVIATKCFVSAPFVAKVRKTMISQGKIKPEAKRVDKRGRKHKFPAKSIRRR